MTPEVMGKAIVIHAAETPAMLAIGDSDKEPDAVSANEDAEKELDAFFRENLPKNEGLDHQDDVSQPTDTSMSDFPLSDEESLALAEIRQREIDGRLDRLQNRILKLRPDQHPSPSEFSKSSDASELKKKGSMVPAMLEAKRKQIEENRQKRLEAEKTEMREAGLPGQASMRTAADEAERVLDTRETQIEPSGNAIAAKASASLPKSEKGLLEHASPPPVPAVIKTESQLSAKPPKLPQEHPSRLQHRPLDDKAKSSFRRTQIARFAFNAEEASVHIMHGDSDDEEADKANQNVSVSSQNREFASERAQTKSDYNNFLNALNGQKKK